MQFCDCCSLVGRFQARPASPSSRLQSSPDASFAEGVESMLLPVGGAVGGAHTGQSDAYRDDPWGPISSAAAMPPTPAIAAAPPTAQVPLPACLLPASSIVSLQPMLVKDQRPQPLFLTAPRPVEPWQRITSAPAPPIDSMGQAASVAALATSASDSTFCLLPAPVAPAPLPQPAAPAAVPLATGRLLQQLPGGAGAPASASNEAGQLLASMFAVQSPSTSWTGAGSSSPIGPFAAEFRPWRQHSATNGSHISASSPLISGGGGSVTPQSQSSSPGRSRRKKKEQSMLEAQNLLKNMLGNQPAASSSPAAAPPMMLPGWCGNVSPGQGRPSRFLGGRGGGAPSAAAVATTFATPAASSPLAGCSGGCPSKSSSSPKARISPLLAGRRGGCGASASPGRATSPPTAAVLSEASNGSQGSRIMPPTAVGPFAFGSFGSGFSNGGGWTSAGSAAGSILRTAAHSGQVVAAAPAIPTGTLGSAGGPATQPRTGSGCSLAPSPALDNWQVQAAVSALAGGHFALTVAQPVQ